MSELNQIALKIISNGKGILAADESTGTMTKRLDSVNVKSTPENRLKFREALFSSKGMEKYIGGVILYDETIKQKTSSGLDVPKLISKSGSIPGIKVDTGAKTLSTSPMEKITEGLDGLRERLKEYYKFGARFTKWRGVYSISRSLPTKLSIYSNAHALARYAALAQEAKMVPIVEPEVLMDGEHEAESCYKITSEVLKICALAATFDLPVIPHGHSSHATAHLLASQPPTLCPIQEYLIKWNVMHQYFLKDKIQPEDGNISVSWLDKPGLGIILDSSVIESEQDLIW